MSDRVQIIGSYISPYVRKVLVFLHIEGIAYEIDPIIPFMGDDGFTRLSPVRRIPVLLDDDGFVRIRAYEDLSCRTPIDRHRDALRAAGAPIMAKSYGTSRPRRGVLRI